MAKQVAEDAEGAGGVPKGLGGLGRGQFSEEEGAQRRILALKGLLGGAEEIGSLSVCYRLPVLTLTETECYKNIV